MSSDAPEHRDSFLARLKRRHIVRWSIAYVAGAWVLLQAAELLFGIFEWPATLLRGITLLLIFGFFATLVLAWFHGEKGQQRVSPIELVLLLVLLVGASATLKLSNVMTVTDDAATVGLFDGKSSRRATANSYYEADPSWAPDSSGLVFVSERSGSPDLWLLQRSGEVTQLTSANVEESQPAWSPVGNKILFVSSGGHGERLDRSVAYGYSFGGDIWSVPAFGGEPEKLVENGHNPSWAPDGSRFAFDSSRGGSRRIWVAAADGTIVGELSEDESDLAVHIRPAWSPDGNWIAFERQPGSQASAGALILVSSDGENSFRLTDGRHRDMSPAWAGPTTIIFASDRGGAMNLWQVDVDLERRKLRGEPQQVTRGAGEDFDPAVARDGTLAYSSSRRLRNLWRVSVDPETLTFGSQPERIMEASWNDFAPAIDAISSALAFSSDRDGPFNIWVLDNGSAEPRQITDRDGGDLQPVWSPDGSKLAFFSDENGNNDIWIKPMAGGPAVAVTPPDSNDVNPYWSSDGSRIGFMSDRSGQSDVWTMRVDGSEARQLTDISALGHTARWSPDDRWLLFTSNAAGNRDVWAVSNDGSELRQLTTGPTQDAHGLWSPDGETVLYLADHQKVFALNFANGDERLVFDLGETIDYTHLSPDGRTFVFTREKVESDIWMIE